MSGGTKRGKADGVVGTKSKFEEELEGFEKDSVGRGTVWSRAPLKESNINTISDLENRPLIFQHIELEESELEERLGEGATQYSSKPKKHPIIRMFGITREGHSVLVNVRNFDAYFYIEAGVENVFSDADLAEYKRKINDLYNTTYQGYHEYPSPVTKLDRCYKKSLFKYSGLDNKLFYKCTVSSFRTISKLRGLVMKAYLTLSNGRRVSPMECYETNIEYKLRFMVDNDISGCNWIELPPNTFKVSACPELHPQGQSLNSRSRSKDYGFAAELSVVGESHCQIEVHVDVRDLVSHSPEGEWLSIAPFRILSFDIECRGRELLFPDASIDPVIQIGCMVQVQGESVPCIKTIFTLGTCANIVGTEVLSFRDEPDMLRRFSEYIVAVDPDIITGYNILNFDLDYLNKRADTLKIKRWPYFTRLIASAMKLKQSRFSSKAAGMRDSLDVAVAGRVVFDAMQFIMREQKLRSYSLNSVAAEFLGEQKEDVHFSIIAQLQDGDEQTRRRLAVYCLKDAYLPLRLLMKLMGIINHIEMARVTGVPITYLLTRGQQIKVISQLLRKCRDKKYVIPVLPGPVDATGDTAAFEGATVIDPLTGYYSTPIATLDFASLYPSIMIAHNLCYTTFVPKPDVHRLGLEVDRDYILTPSGDHFVKAHIVPGLLPEILMDLLAARKKAKLELGKEIDVFRRGVLDGRQLALKISANSVYGFTGAVVGRLPCLEISQSVTAFGRDMIYQVKNMIETPAFDSHLDCRVIYGDTDSVMIQMWNRSNPITLPAVDNLLLRHSGIVPVAKSVMSPLEMATENVPVTLTEAMAFGKKTSALISATFKQPIKLEFEKVYFPYLLISKKRYAGLYWTSPDKYDKMDCKGLEAVRRDNCPLVKNIITVSLQNLLIHKDKELAERHVRSVISSLLQNKIDISELVITKALSKPGSEYHGKQAHVELAARMKARDPQSAPKIGDRIPFVIIKGQKGVAAYEKAEDPIYVLDNGLPIDTAYYLSNQLSKPLLRIFEPVLGPSRAHNLLNGEHTRHITKELPTKGGGILSFAKKMDACLGCKTLLKKDSLPVSTHPTPKKQYFCKDCVLSKGDLYQREILKVQEYETKFNRLWVQCQRCQGSLHQEVLCTSKDCPIFYMRKKIQIDLTKQNDIISKFEI